MSDWQPGTSVGWYDDDPTVKTSTKVRFMEDELAALRKDKVRYEFLKSLNLVEFSARLPNGEYFEISQCMGDEDIDAAMEAEGE